MKKNKALAIATVSLLIATFSPITANANHSWNAYHWARTTNPFTLQLDDNLTTADWRGKLSTTSKDWNKSTVLQTNLNLNTSNVKCVARVGRVQVCNKTYGSNGWLGIASVSISGKHITAGTVKVNDTYFNTTKYNRAEWKNLVMCQEVGHTFGLNHQDEIFGNLNLGTCMDYTNLPSSNQTPNQGDYDQLLCIYDSATAKISLNFSPHACTGTGHLDGTTTLASTTLTLPDSTNANSEDPASWGKEMSKDSRGRGSQFEKDLGKGEKLITFVIWAD